MSVVAGPVDGSIPQRVHGTARITGNAVRMEQLDPGSHYSRLMSQVVRIDLQTEQKKYKQKRKYGFSHVLIYTMN